MTKIRSSRAILALLLALGPYAAPAQAQLSRTFVSAATGNDANNCDRPTPCRTFQGAHNKTNDLGEITVLDPGGYGAVRITKSISIVNDGVGEAGILVGGGIGITIDGGAASYVNLRGITIQGIVGGGAGIEFRSGFSLTIENCVVRSHSSDGIRFLPTASSNLAVSNTLVADNGGDGILVAPDGPGTVKASFNRIDAYNNKSVGIEVFGGFSSGTISATVTDSVAAGNAFAGFRSHLAMAPTSLTVIRSVAANNGTGLDADAGAILRVGQSTVAGNATSWKAAGGGILRSYGDNNIDGNGDGDPPPPTIPNK